MGRSIACEYKNKEMKILIACTIYLVSDGAVEELRQSFQTFNRSKEYEYVAYETACGRGYKEKVQDLFDKWKEVPKNCLGMSWNMALEDAVLGGYDYVIFPNLDVRLYGNGFGGFIKMFARECEVDESLVMGSMWSNNSFFKHPEKSYYTKQEGMSNWDAYAMFIVDPERLVSKVGYFSEEYTAYHSDMDMEHRIGLAGCKHKVLYKKPDTIFYHTGQVTLKTHPDVSWASKYLQNNKSDDVIFYNKWGARPRLRLWKHPYKDRKLDHKFIGKYE